MLIRIGGDLIRQSEFGDSLKWMATCGSAIDAKEVIFLEQSEKSFRQETGQQRTNCVKHIYFVDLEDGRKLG